MQHPDAAPHRRGVVVFDVGGVLLEWDPRHLYRKLFDGDDAAMEHFLSNVCTVEWNECQDAGRTFADAAAEQRIDEAPPVRAIAGEPSGQRPAVDGDPHGISCKYGSW